MNSYRAFVETTHGEVQFQFKANNDGEAYERVNNKYPKGKIIKIEKNLGLSVWQPIYRK